MANFKYSLSFIATRTGWSFDWKPLSSTRACLLALPAASFNISMKSCWLKLCEHELVASIPPLLSALIAAALSFLYILYPAFWCFLLLISAGGSRTIISNFVWLFFCSSRYSRASALRNQERQHFWRRP